MEKLNITGKELCERVGVAHHRHILIQLRELGLVNFFKIGSKYLYHSEDAKKISDKLRNGEISIKVNGGYYITLNN
tara:strand:+ start:4197 stop:4424 length:228 start_codon:yes stop_codon:yes gene_type:complete